jgi:Phage tail lysozyme
MAYPNGQEIWDYLMGQFENAYGVAGLMGNLYAESGLYPFRLQGDYDSEHFYPVSHEYSADVNDGTITESQFVNDGKGYGLAQWTYYTRKQALYDYTIDAGYTIDNLQRQLEYLVLEIISDYPTVKNAMLHATSVRQASDVVLHDFENPEVQTEEVEIQRANYGIDIYNTYSGQPPIPPIPPTPPTPTGRKMPLYMYLRKV